MQAGFQFLGSADHGFGHHIGFDGAVLLEQAAGQTVDDLAQFSGYFLSPAVFVSLSEQYGGLKNVDSPERQRFHGFFQFSFNLRVIEKAVGVSADGGNQQ